VSISLPVVLVNICSYILIGLYRLIEKEYPMDFIESMDEVSK